MIGGLCSSHKAVIFYRSLLAEGEKAVSREEGILVAVLNGVIFNCRVFGKDVH